MHTRPANGGVVPNIKKQHQGESYDGLSILAAIRLDQANRGLRDVSQATVRKLEQQAERLARETPFTVLAGME